MSDEAWLEEQAREIDARTQSMKENLGKTRKARDELVAIRDSIAPRRSDYLESVIAMAEKNIAAVEALFDGPRPRSSR